MEIQRVAYAFVQPQGKLPNCEMAAVEAEVLDYLVRHLTKIQEKARQSIVDPARFQKVGGARPGEERFVALQTGSGADFLDAADALVKRLHEETDNRMNRGFFVALRALEKKRALAAVLKLDVYEFPGARLAEQKPGQAQFEPVLDLLDLPGDLHKGALFPDPRKTSDLAVVDVFATNYFLRSLDARLYQSGQAAVDRFYFELRKKAGDDAAKKVMQEAAQRETPAAAATLVRASKALAKEAKQEILQQLEQPRSIGRVDAKGHPRTTTIYADGIEISGTEKEVAAKVKDKQEGAKWVTTITSNNRPIWKTR